MTAPDREPQDGMEAAFITLVRRFTSKQRALLDALLRRYVDGQPLDEALVEACVEMGDPPDVARRRVAEALSGPSANWRDCLT